MSSLTKKIFLNEISTHCPVCASPVFRGEYVYAEGDFESRIFSCPSCAFLFGRPVFIPETDKRQMDSVDDAELFNSKTLRFLHEKFILGREISAVTQLLGDGKHTLLDIGCGTGWTTHIWQKAGFDVAGLEPSSNRRKLAEDRYGFKVYPCYLEQLEPELKYDIVILRHVLEHFADPFEMLQKVTSLLNPGGMLLLVVPNIDCLGRRIFGVDWEWVLPWHCNFFNSKSLIALVERLGLTVRKVYKTPTPLYYKDSFLRKCCSEKLRKFMSRLGILGDLLLLPLPVVGALTGHGDNLTMIAQLDVPKSQ